MKIADVTIDVIVCLPDDITFIIIRLDRAADVVTDNAVMLVTNNLGSRDVAVTVVNLRDEIPNWLIVLILAIIFPSTHSSTYFHHLQNNSLYNKDQNHPCDKYNIYLYSQLSI